MILPGQDRRAEALQRCVEAVMAARGRPLSIHQLGAATGVSARMLIHHFATKAALEAAISDALGVRLRASLDAVMLRHLPFNLASLEAHFADTGPEGLATLLRVLAARALTGDATAAAVLRECHDLLAARLGVPLGESQGLKARVLVRLAGLAVLAGLDSPD
jgi:AcrR family transcriptional regulator